MSSTGPWPTQSQELLLKAAVVRSPTALDSWRRWTATLDPRALDLDADSQALFPLVYRNLDALGADEAYGQLLKGTHRYWWCSNQLHLHRVAALLDGLRDAGIPTLLLGGVGTAVQFYPDSGARPMKAIEILVSADRSQAAWEHLRRGGWRPAPGHGEAGFRLCGTARMVAVGGEALELSWRSWSGGPDGRADQGFWRRSAPLTIHQASARGLAPGDALLQTVVEALRGARPGLWWIADAMTILSVAADHVDWETLVEEAGRRRIQMPLVAGLEYLQAVFAGPIPVNALEGLRARTPSRLERLEFRHGPVVSRERRMGSRVARIVAEYLRIVSGRSLGAKLAGLPGFLGHRLRARAQGAVTRVFRTSRRASIEAR